jgi:bifunctional enzyme CysN/CysC
LTCGSVDDGKSTLIGRLLFDTGQVLEDQLEALQGDNRRFGTVRGGMDFALLVDGLRAEREQGITIDVAYRYFSTPRRKFMVVDAPGHEQYTRNMATGASACDLAVMLVDARKGVQTQTRRHAHIVHLLGIRHVVLAVNKMDLVSYSLDVFAAIAADFERFARALGVERVVCIPVVATSGGNIVHRCREMSWYSQETLIEHLERVELAGREKDRPFRMPVQLASRPTGAFRGFAGTLTGGTVRKGDAVVLLPSGTPTKVARLVTDDGDLEQASGGDAVTLVFADDVDAGRGTVVAPAESPPEMADQVAAHLIWMGAEPMLPGRAYIMKCATQTARATVTALKHKINVDNLEHTAARHLEINEIAFCNLSLSQPLVFDPYEADKTLGSFILIDRASNETVAAGLLRFGLRRSANVRWQALTIDKQARAASLRQQPRCLWLTGLSGAGKSTIANLLEKRLHALGHHTYVLDGDNMRHGLNRDLGFADADRVENVRRIAEVARILLDAGLVVIVSAISPFRSERRTARELFAAGEFVEIFVDAPISVCERRDPKGLYRKARAGLISNFTGIGSAYEPPEVPDMRLATDEFAPEELVAQVLGHLGPRLAIGDSER